MKVVLFCGGLGTRLREHSDTIPKPLVPVGDRPIIWQLMKYYAHFGHKDFILCLGFQGEMLRDYFLNYNPYSTQTFSIEPGGIVSPKNSDISDWRITFVDTGLHANIGQRLLQVRQHLDGEDVFMANYSDQLSDLPLTEHITGRANCLTGLMPSWSTSDLPGAQGKSVSQGEPLKRDWSSR